MAKFYVHLKDLSFEKMDEHVTQYIEEKNCCVYLHPKYRHLGYMDFSQDFIDLEEFGYYIHINEHKNIVYFERLDNSRTLTVDPITGDVDCQRNDESFELIMWDRLEQ